MFDFLRASVTPLVSVKSIEQTSSLGLLRRVGRAISFKYLAIAQQKLFWLTCILTSSFLLLKPMLHATKRTVCEETLTATLCFNHSQISRLSFGSLTCKQRKMYSATSSLCSSVNTSEGVHTVCQHGTPSLMVPLLPASQGSVRNCVSSSFKKYLRSSSATITIDQRSGYFVPWRGFPSSSLSTQRFRFLDSILAYSRSAHRLKALFIGSWGGRRGAWT